MMKLDYYIAINPAPADVILDGPVLVGVAQGALSAAQIEATLDRIVTGQGSITPLEESSRPVWPLELFNIPDADSGDNSSLTRKGEKTIRWTFNNPDGWSWWAYNMSSAVLITGNNFNCIAKCFGMWVT